MLYYSKNPYLQNNINYTRYRNNLTSILRVCERSYYAEQIEINKHDLKKSLKLIKEILGIKTVIQEETEERNITLTVF